MLCTLLLALLFLPALTENLRMVIVFGRVTVPSETVLTSLSKDECLNKCFFDSYCILASFYSHETCSLYNYITTQTLTVTETDREDGFYVAFKTSMPSDFCPASLNSINLTVTVLEDTYHWIRTESGWYFKKCVADWKLFHRKNNVSVCMQSFNMTYGSTIQQARQMCQGKGRVLSGIATVEESQWFMGKVLELTKNKYNGFWIDGERNCSEGERCNNFIWTDGYTTDNELEPETYSENNFDFSYENVYEQIENCLIICLNPYNRSMNDVSCVDSNFQWALGAVCGYKLN